VGEWFRIDSNLYVVVSVTYDEELRVMSSVQAV
jgi:hypothetical protein